MSSKRVASHPMEKIMKLAMAALALLILIPAARADSVITVTVSNVTWGDSTGTPETLNLSYTEDLTTGVVSDYEFSFVGPLGPFTGPTGALTGRGLRQWTDPEGDTLEYAPSADGPNFSMMLPELGSYPPFALFDFSCNETTFSCFNFFLFFEQQRPDDNSGTITVSAVPSAPEPETWTLLLAGIGLVVGFRARSKRLCRVCQFKI